jgi:hypothetical protein
LDTSELQDIGPASYDVVYASDALYGRQDFHLQVPKKTSPTRNCDYLKTIQADVGNFNSTSFTSPKQFGETKQAQRFGIGMLSATCQTDR